MSYFINPVEEEQCVFLSYEGDMPPLELVAARYEASGVLAAKQWNRLVVDVTQSQSVTALEVLEFVRGMASTALQGNRVAFVVRPEQARYIGLIKDIGRNRGVILSLFYDAENATTWVNDASHMERANRLQASRHSSILLAAARRIDGNHGNSARPNQAG